MQAPDPASSDLTRRRLLALAAALGATLPCSAEAAHPKGVASTAAPVHIGSIGLRVKDLETVAQWYEHVLGLKRLPGTEADRLLLGAGGIPLLELIGDPSLRLAARDEAGLYHTAFLLPARRDLGLWIHHAIARQIPVDGVADHLVSEAVYLTDPEGNGVEICTDRDPALWRWQGDQVQMGTEALDVEGLMALDAYMPVFWTGAPTGTVIGHVHLKVGDAPRAAAFWQEKLGFDAVRARRDAVFLSTGGYHHHIAVNSWDSPGAPHRDPKATGLAYVELQSRGDLAASEITDPWGSVIRITSKG